MGSVSYSTRNLQRAVDSRLAKIVNVKLLKRKVTGLKQSTKLGRQRMERNTPRTTLCLEELIDTTSLPGIFMAQDGLPVSLQPLNEEQS
jgi:hypothetical protein